MLACSWLLATTLCFGMVAQNNPPSPSIDPAVRADIVKLMDLTGAVGLGQQMANAMLDTMLASLRTAQPDLPERAFSLVKEVLLAEFKTAFEAKDGLMEQILQIYARHFNAEEIRGLVAFYSTQLGRKVTSTLPALMQDSMKVGQDWGVQVAPRVEQKVFERLKAEGYIK